MSIKAYSKLYKVLLCISYSGPRFTGITGDLKSPISKFILGLKMTTFDAITCHTNYFTLLYLSMFG